MTAGLRREAGGALRAESGAAPATVSGEWWLHFVSLSFRTKLGKAGAATMTRKPGDLPSTA